MKAPGATARQREVLKLIAEGAGSGLVPTLRELGDELGIKSVNGVNDHLLALARKGLVERHGPRRARAWKVTTAGHRELGRAA